jgi:hypothetical protein
VLYDTKLNFKLLSKTDSLMAFLHRLSTPERRILK